MSRLLTLDWRKSAAQNRIQPTLLSLFERKFYEKRSDHQEYVTNIDTKVGYTTEHGLFDLLSSALALVPPEQRQQPKHTPAERDKLTVMELEQAGISLRPRGAAQQTTDEQDPEQGFWL